MTIKFIVGFPAGGAQDIVGRIIADRLGALWKATTVVENVPGAGGNLAMDRVAKGSTDGTQICIIPPGIATNQFLYSKMPFDPEKDIVPLGLVATVPNLLCVRKDLPVNSVAELIAYAKANPGKLNYASSGNGTTIHLSAELFKRMAGVEMVHVAYRGSAPALNDLVGQSVDLMFDNITSIIGQARAGAVKPLGITLTEAVEPGAGIRSDRRHVAGLRDDLLDGCRRARRYAQGDLRQDRGGYPHHLPGSDAARAARGAGCRDVHLQRGRDRGLHRVRARQVGQAHHGHQTQAGIAARPMSRRKKPEDLRSHRWFGVQDLRSFGHRSRLRQIGYDAEDWGGKPVIGIINTWSDINACHAHLRARAEDVKRGVLQAGGFPLELPAISLAEPFVKPTTMLYRNFLAMETEELLRSHPIDGAILLGGCDKTTPGLLMGAISMGLPAIFCPAGPMLRGNWRGQQLGSGSDVWKYWDEKRAGRISEDDWAEMENGIARSFGTCMTMGTAATMMSIAEALGMTLPGASAMPAADAGHPRMCATAGRRIVEMVWEDLTPDKILTAASLRERHHACTWRSAAPPTPSSTWWPWRGGPASRCRSSSSTRSRAPCR